MQIVGSKIGSKIDSSKIDADAGSKIDADAGSKMDADASKIDADSR